MSLKPLMVAFLALILLGACRNYHHISLTGSDLYKKKKIAANVDEYDVFVHSGKENLVLTATEISETEITGKIKEIRVDDIRTANPDDDRIPTEEEKNDIHIYLHEDYEISVDSAMQPIALTEPAIRSVRMSGKEQQGVLGVVGTVLLVLVGAIVALFLILILAIASDGSGSGGSDSGGSDSGGSDSNSSCYIATMTYGSYDAPQVLVLRRFRDQFLQKNKPGRAFIRWYYANSPAFVERHRSKQWLHKVLRVGLNGLVGVLKRFYP